MDKHDWPDPDHPYDWGDYPDEALKEMLKDADADTEPPGPPAPTPPAP